MTDFELVTLYTEQIALFQNSITILTTILFSFIAAMHFMARKVHPALLVILSALFAAVSFGLLGGLYSAGKRAATIGEQIVARIGAEGSEIPWMHSGVIPMGLPRNFFYFFMAAILVALVFVVIRRMENRNRNTG